jgi:hypothetical protein
MGPCVINKDIPSIRGPASAMVRRHLFSFRMKDTGQGWAKPIQPGLTTVRENSPRRAILHNRARQLFGKSKPLDCDVNLK